MAKKSKRSKRSSRAKKQEQQKNLFIGGSILIILIIILIMVFGNSDEQLTETLPRNITVNEAFDYREQGALILDVRTQEEWNAGHIPGATLIPLDELSSRVDELPKNMDIVVVCRSGNRSATARDILLTAGFSSVTSMDGGVNQWAAAGFPME